MKVIKMFEVKVTCGTWNHSYRMGACSSCGAIVKAMNVYGGNGVRISAKPATAKGV